jgi:hypothetical protein
MLFGLLFNPFFGGCLGLIIFLLILSGIVVFVSVNFVWIILIGLIFYAISALVKYYRWHQLPDFTTYVTKHPQCKVDSSGGASCCACGSTQSMHNGLFGHKSKWRFYICTQCGTLLFRFKVL